MVKTKRGVFDRMAAEVKKIHSYDVAEIIGVPVTHAIKDYHDWVLKETE